MDEGKDEDESKGRDTDEHNGREGEGREERGHMQLKQKLKGGGEFD